MIALLLLLLAPIIVGLAVLGAPIAVALGVIAVPVIAILALISLAAIGVGDLSGALAGVSAPTAHSLEVFGIAVGILLALAALVYLIAVGIPATRQPVIRRAQAVAVPSERNVPQVRQEVVTSLRRQDIPYDLAAQCQEQRLVPCPV